MDKNFDVVAMGELLIDFTMHGLSQENNLLYEACPGGAPCNVLAMLTKLGKKTAFIGKVGKDQFGKRLKETLEEIGISTTGLVTDNEVNTTLAFVHTLPDGDRDFSFYRNPGADMMLTEKDVSKALVQQGKIFHFGTLSMTHPEVRNATKRAIELAKDSGALISFDPNLRAPLWSSMDLAKQQMDYGFNNCDILKLSDNEIEFFTGKNDYDEAVQCLKRKYQIPLILLTLGKDGSRAYYKDICVKQEGFSCNSIETTGAGDTFCGSVLNYILDNGLYNLTEAQLSEMLVFANAAAALVTTKKGALCSMPEVNMVHEFIENAVIREND